jgi:hypothetical protein
VKIQHLGRPGGQPETLTIENHTAPGLAPIFHF